MSTLERVKIGLVSVSDRASTGVTRTRAFRH